MTWDEAAHAALVAGKPAALKSQTKVTAEQILAIGLPDLVVETLPGEAAVLVESDLPASLHLNIKTVIDHLLLSERDKREAHKQLAFVTDNMRALGVIDEHGNQVKGEIIRQLRGLDGLFVYFALMNADLQYPLARALVEFSVDHNVIHKIMTRKLDGGKREWIKNKLRERRRDEPQVTWEDVEADYEREFPRELTPVEKLHSEFVALMPHPELHGGKVAKAIWAEMEDEELGFMDFVEKHDLATEEGSLFSYLARVMKFAKMLADATGLDEFKNLNLNVRQYT